MATRKTKAKPKVKAKPKAKAKAKAKPKAAAKAKPKVQAKAKLKAKPKPAAAEANRVLAISQKAQKSGLASLTPAERDVHVLSDLHERVVSGGLSGFLHHAFGAGGEEEWRGRDIVLAIQALRRAGQTRYATLLDRALRILLRPAHAGAVSWEGFLLSVDPKEELKQMEDEVFELNEPLFDLVESRASELPGVS